MKRFPLRELAHVVAMSGVVLAAVRCGGPEDPHAHDDATEFNVQSALLTRNRDALRLCVQESASLRGSAARINERLGASLRAVSNHPDWAAARFGDRKPTIEQGCPGPALALERLEPKESIIGPGLALKASRYRTFIHVLDEKTADVVLGERQVDRAPAEFLRVDDHVLAEVSTALVVRESYLDHPEFAARWLAGAVGLQAREDGLPGVLGDVLDKPVTDTSSLTKPGLDPTTH
ncbi:hypothetical protein [Corallococcus macrosporus]|uniref:Lipoprotein n=1 Tax=Myxococcus fulvus (strain ATCC BAA-855 / HW-1) TaxID=483219 RepID=F8CBC8_MYXFH|nr:hypothetical protein [Corallococcus macrosporus]AEI63335.1 hypothetical protein LILAB_07100 [Corallococcus macrosporus]